MDAIFYYLHYLKHFLTLPYIISILGMSIPIIWVLLKSEINRKGMFWLLAIYGVSFFYFNVLGRYTLDESEQLLLLSPFWSYIRSFTEPDYYLMVQNVLNILIFIPIGALLHTVISSKKKVFAIGFIYGAFLEVFQLILRKGYFDIDDFINNSIGIVLGILLFDWMRKQRNKARYTITKYDFSKGKEPIQLCVLSDLHEFDVSVFLKEVESIHPDLILLVGDVLERRKRHKYQKKDEYTGNWFLYRLAWFLDDVLEFFFGFLDRKSEHSFEFLKEARKIAPIVYSRGNHEKEMEEEDYQFFKEQDIIFLDNQDVELTIRGRTISIGGLSTTVDELWLESFSKKEGEKILMMHHPEYYEEVLVSKNYDLILSGHAHGGQIRIGKQGIFAPGQGLFPKYTKGLYDENFVISTGCSNTSYVPRIGNPKEILDIKF